MKSSSSPSNKRPRIERKDASSSNARNHERSQHPPSFSAANDDAAAAVSLMLPSMQLQHHRQSQYSHQTTTSSLEASSARPHHQPQLMHPSLASARQQQQLVTPTPHPTSVLSSSASPHQQSLSSQAATARLAMALSLQQQQQQNVVAPEMNLCQILKNSAPAAPQQLHSHTLAAEQNQQQLDLETYLRHAMQQPSTQQARSNNPLHNVAAPLPNSVTVPSPALVPSTAIASQLESMRQLEQQQQSLRERQHQAASSLLTASSLSTQHQHDISSSLAALVSRQQQQHQQQRLGQHAVAHPTAIGAASPGTIPDLATLKQLLARHEVDQHERTRLHQLQQLSQNCKVNVPNDASVSTQLLMGTRQQSTGSTIPTRAAATSAELTLTPELQQIRNQLERGLLPQNSNIGGDGSRLPSGSLDTSLLELAGSQRQQHASNAVAAAAARTGGLDQAAQQVVQASARLQRIQEASVLTAAQRSALQQQECLAANNLLLQSGQDHHALALSPKTELPFMQHPDASSGASLSAVAPTLASLGISSASAAKHDPRQEHRLGGIDTSTTTAAVTAAPNPFSDLLQVLAAQQQQQQQQTSVQQQRFSAVQPPSSVAAPPLKLPPPPAPPPVEVPSNRISNVTTPMAVPADLQNLAPYQNLMRQQLEFFRATEEDVADGSKGRNHPIRKDQVGIRCLHCGHLPVTMRARGAMYYPTTLEGIYQSAQHLSKGHLHKFCTSIPAETRLQLWQFSRMKPLVKQGGKGYWASAAKQQGVYELDGRLALKVEDEEEGSTEETESSQKVEEE